MWCQIVVGPQFQNFMSKCCIFTWRRALDFFYCYPKLSNFFSFPFLKVVLESKLICSLASLNAKTGEKPPNHVVFS